MNRIERATERVERFNARLERIQKAIPGFQPLVLVCTAIIMVLMTVMIVTDAVHYLLGEPLTLSAEDAGLLAVFLLYGLIHVLVLFLADLEKYLDWKASKLERRANELSQ